MNVGQLDDSPGVVGFLSFTIVYDTNEKQGDHAALTVTTWVATLDTPYLGERK